MQHLRCTLCIKNKSVIFFGMQSTYCESLQQHCEVINRTVHVVNLGELSTSTTWIAGNFTLGIVPWTSSTWTKIWFNKFLKCRYRALLNCCRALSLMIYMWPILTSAHTETWRGRIQVEEIHKDVQWPRTSYLQACCMIRVTSDSIFKQILSDLAGDRAWLCTEWIWNFFCADPAAEQFNYPVSFDIRDLVPLEDVMDEMKLGPNG